MQFVRYRFRVLLSRVRARAAGANVFVHRISRRILGKKLIDYLVRDRPPLKILVKFFEVRRQLIGAPQTESGQQLEKQIDATKRRVCDVRRRAAGGFPQNVGSKLVVICE